MENQSNSANCTFLFGSVRCHRLIQVQHDNENGIKYCSLHRTLLALQSRLENSLRNRNPPIEIKPNECFALVSFILILAKNRRDNSGADVIAQLRQNPVIEELISQFEKIVMDFQSEELMVFEDELAKEESEHRNRKTEK